MRLPIYLSLIVLFNLLPSLIVLAEEPNGHVKWEAECFNAALEMREVETRKLDKSFCSNPSMPMSFRQMPVIVHNLFTSKKKDVQEKSMKMLQSYTCENEVACAEYVMELENAKDEHRRYNKKWKSQIDALIKKLQTSEALQNQSGLCAPTSDRAMWLEKLYQIFCPTKHVGTSGGNFLDKPLFNNRFTFALALHSGQSYMSSSLLSSVQHVPSKLGTEDCEDPWTVTLKCGGMKEESFILSCSKTNGVVKCN